MCVRWGGVCVGGSICVCMWGVGCKLNLAAKVVSISPYLIPGY